GLTYLGSNQAASAGSAPGISPWRRGWRVERSCRLVAWIKFQFRGGGPCQWAIPPDARRVGPDGIEPPTSSMWARRSAAELWTNDRGTGDGVPRRRCALDHQALRTE